MVACNAGSDSSEQPKDAELPINAHYADKDEIESLAEFEQRKADLTNSVVQGVDLRNVSLPDLQASKIGNTLFLGSKLTDEQQDVLLERGAVVIEPLQESKFDPYRGQLYSQEDLDTPGANDGPTLDELIYHDYEEAGRFPSDSLQAHARSLHDNSMEDALREFLTQCPLKDCKGFVGIMGGASEPRGTDLYIGTARIARALTSAGYFVVTGGGTGMMEAGNLGAYLVSATDEELDAAIALLKTKPNYSPGANEGYTQAEYKAVAREVRKKFAGGGAPSLGIPTWFYGHEPTNAFATHVAKYFSNGIREDRLLEVSSRGLVIVKGSAGTRQEIFMEAAQEHYATFGYCAPIIFVGDTFKSEFDVVYKAAEKASTVTDPVKRTFYIDVLKTAANPDEVVNVVNTTPRLKATGTLCPKAGT